MKSVFNAIYIYICNFESQFDPFLEVEYWVNPFLNAPVDSVGKISHHRFLGPMVEEVFSIA